MAGYSDLEITKKLLEQQGVINRLKAAVERAQKWATFTPPKAGTCLDAPTEETDD